MRQTSEEEVLEVFASSAKTVCILQYQVGKSERANNLNYDRLH